MAEVVAGSELGEWGTGIDPMGFVGVGIKAVLPPPSPSPMDGTVGMRPDDLVLLPGSKVGINPLLPVAPRRESTPDPSAPSKPPDVGAAGSELVADAGMLTGIDPDWVALLSPLKPKRPRRSDPELVGLGLAVLESEGATGAELLVGPPRRLSRPVPMSPKMLPPDAAVEDGVVDA